MTLLLKILFIYIPALVGYGLVGIALLIQGGYIQYPDAHPPGFDPSDYKPVYSEIVDTAHITYHAKKDEH